MAVIVHEDLPGGMLDVSDVKFIPITLTPSLASFFLSNNYHGQRKINDRQRRLYASELKKGTWHGNTTAIGISKNGELMDGQHRCAAVVSSGISMKAFLETGMTEEDFKGLDRNLKRNGANILAAYGAKAPSDAQALTLKMCALDFGYATRTCINCSQTNLLITMDDIVDEYVPRACQIDRLVATASALQGKIGKASKVSISFAFYLLEEFQNQVMAQNYERDLVEQNTALSIKLASYILKLSIKHGPSTKMCKESTVAAILYAYDRWTEDKNAPIKRTGSVDSILDAYDKLIILRNQRMLAAGGDDK